MKKVIDYHITAAKETFNVISQGKFLIYFVPSLTITLIFIFFFYSFDSLFETGNDSESAGWLSSTWSKITSVFDFIVTQLYIFVVITLLSPFNTLLSEKLDNHLTKQDFPFSMVRLINDFFRMVLIVILAILLEFLFLGVWWLFCWIFGISDTIFYKIMTFLISSFFFGFSFYDHSLERYKVNVFGSIGFAFSNILTLIITGSIFNLLYYFPYIWETSFIGIIIAPVLTTMISTIVYIQYRGLYTTKQQVDSVS